MFKVGDKVKINNTYPESKLHGFTGKVKYADYESRYPISITLDEPWSNKLGGIDFMGRLYEDELDLIEG